MRYALEYLRTCKTVERALGSVANRRVLPWHCPNSWACMVLCALWGPLKRVLDSLPSTQVTDITLLGIRHQTRPIIVVLGKTRNGSGYPQGNPVHLQHPWDRRTATYVTQQLRITTCATYCRGSNVTIATIMSIALFSRFYFYKKIYNMEAIAKKNNNFADVYQKQSRISESKSY